MRISSDEQGQHSRNEATSSRRGWREGRTLLGPGPWLPELQMSRLTMNLHSFPNAAGECSATNPKGRSLFSICQNDKDTQSLTSARGRSPVMQIQSLSLGNAATEAREGREGGTKAF